MDNWQLIGGMEETMSNIEIAIKKAKGEARKNYKRAMHNLTCENVDDLQPYDNTEYLNMVSVVKGLLLIARRLGRGTRPKTIRGGN
jgi:hypothetical protein